MEFKDGLTAVVAFTVVWLGHRFTSQRSVADQLWDLRRSTYSFILGKMAEMDSLARSMQGYIDQYGWPRDADRFDEMDRKLWESRDAIQGRVVADFLTISPRIRKLMAEFYDVFRDHDEDDPDPVARNLSMHEGLTRNVRKYGPMLEDMAMEELDDLRRGVLGRMWHRLMTGQRPSPRE